MNQLDATLQEIESISLAEMDGVALLKRTDTKFVFGRRLLIPLLQKLKPYYRVLEVEGLRKSNYETVYYDTENLAFYLDHHNGRPKRIKVRHREYVDSGLKFFEIKVKTNKGQTDKKRIRVSEMNKEEQDAFVEKTTMKSWDIHPVLNNSFGRITLVHKEKEERFTIDTGLNFSCGGKAVEIPQLVIAELKQGNASRETPSYQSLKAEGIRPMGMSKYCIGMAMLNSRLKQNNFKMKLNFIEKL